MYRASAADLLRSLISKGDLVRVDGGLRRRPDPQQVVWVNVSDGTGEGKLTAFTHAEASAAIAAEQARRKAATPEAQTESRIAALERALAAEKAKLDDA